MSSSSPARLRIAPLTTADTEPAPTYSSIAWTGEQLAIFELAFATPPTPDSRHKVIRARAGTGKSTVCNHGMSLATWASDILYCAFNKRIVEEFTRKCVDPRVEIKTLHGIGFGFLRAKAGSRRITVDGDRELQIARKLLATGAKDAPFEVVSLAAKLAVKVKEIAPFGVHADAIDLAWRFDCLPDDGSGYTVDDIASYALAVCAASQVFDGTISFADMLYLPLALNLVRPIADLVVVDEAQDMSPSQIEISKRCVRPSGRIVVVGDDRQGIYAFRGADSNTIDNLKAELSAGELGLTVTHRCPRSIVAYAAELVPDYRAADTAPEGSIRTIRYAQLATTVKPGAFILSRKNAPLMSVCLSLLRAGIRAKIQGKDIGKQLSDLVRKLKANSIADLISRLQVWRAKEIARAQARGNGVGRQREDTVHDIAETIITLAEDVVGIGELTTKLASLFDEVASIDVDGPVICSSVHKAKGLEAGEVYILADTLYPGGKRDKLEEQNIEYVAVTRSKSSLTWVVQDAA